MFRGDRGTFRSPRIGPVYPQGESHKFTNTVVPKRIYIYMNTHTYTHNIYIYKYICADIYIHVCVCMYVYKYVYKCVTIITPAFTCSLFLIKFHI